MTDWALLNHADVQETCKRIAQNIASRYTGVVEYADMLQEAYIAVATHPRQFGAYVENEEWGHFSNALWQDVNEKAKKEARYSNRVVSIDDVTEYA